MSITNIRLQSRAPLGLALAVLLIYFLILHSGYSINRSKSMPVGIYRATHRPPARGAIVLACLPERIVPLARRRGYVDRGTCPGSVRQIGKYLVGLPGDTVTVTEEHVTISGVRLPQSRPLRKDSVGRDVTPKYGTYILGEGQYFPFSGHHPASFDSRYFGPVDSLLTVIEPVFIIGNSFAF